MDTKNITVIVNNKKFYMSLDIVSKSPVLKKMLEDNFNDKKIIDNMPTIILPNQDPKIFQHVINFIMYDEITFDRKHEAIFNKTLDYLSITRKYIIHEIILELPNNLSNLQLSCGEIIRIKKSPSMKSKITGIYTSTRKPSRYSATVYTIIDGNEFMFGDNNSFVIINQLILDKINSFEHVDIMLEHERFSKIFVDIPRICFDT